MLRVTSGSLKGFKLDVPSEEAVRPPLESLREAVFNIVGQDLAPWRVADVFAGSGIMGIEALSRGASSAVFVERSRRACRVIERNLERTGLSARSRVLAGDALSGSLDLGQDGPPDLVFIDPPFEMIRRKETRARVLRLVERLFLSDALASEALVLLRFPAKFELDEVPEGALLAEERVYGQSRLLFFNRGEPAARPPP